MNNIHIWSDEFYNILGIKREDIHPSLKAFLPFIHPEDINDAKAKVKRAFEIFEGSYFYFRIKTTDGSKRYIYSEWKFEFDKSKNPIRLYGILQDITERKKQKKQLKKATSATTMLPKPLQMPFGIGILFQTRFSGEKDIFIFLVKRTMRKA